MGMLTIFALTFSKSFLRLSILIIRHYYFYKENTIEYAIVSRPPPAMFPHVGGKGV